ncbi:MAG TPA: hypothetical protein QGF58_21440 [Myxococcota bacterium]|nr:hypothetical protein [Myxococcota bacterium]
MRTTITETTVGMLGAHRVPMASMLLEDDYDLPDGSSARGVVCALVLEDGPAWVGLGSEVFVVDATWRVVGIDKPSEDDNGTITLERLDEGPDHWTVTKDPIATWDARVDASDPELWEAVVAAGRDSGAWIARGGSPDAPGVGETVLRSAAGASTLADLSALREGPSRPAVELERLANGPPWGDGRYRLGIHIYSDIFLPWVWGAETRDDSAVGYLPNTFAADNAGRLNDFLGRVRALVEARGGSWRLWAPDEDEPWHSEMLTEGGIDLDGQP